MAITRGPAVTLLATALLAAGCGNERRVPPKLATEPSAAKAPQSFPRAGLRLELPGNVQVNRTAPPGLFFGTFGESVVSVFAYRRREALPASQADLSQALGRLERATEKRDPQYRLRSSATREVDSSRATELVGDQTIDNKDLRTRSVHVYKGKAEYVLELLAPRADFDRLDRDLFEPMLDSLQITGRVRRPAK